jgi:hypothetical protein
MTENQFIANTINLDTHPSLIDGKQLVYLLNGDIQGTEGSGNGVFVQNMLGNTSCVTHPTGFTLIGSIQLDKFEFVLFYASSDNSEIGLFNSDTCTYTQIVRDACLNFTTDSIVRGVFKYTSDNKRRIYWIDGVNPNRYMNIYNDGSWEYPKTLSSGSRCDCSFTESSNLDCEAIQINKFYQKPCIEITKQSGGFLPNGTYQVGVAYGEDNMVLTDFVFSPVVKLFKEYINVDISCSDNTFTQAKLILVSQTTSGLIIYDLGFYQKDISLTITNNNYPVISTQEALQKRVIYDKSKHITINQEHLLLGSHEAIEPIPYQRQANNITAQWVEIKVPKAEAHNYFSFMRDEVYAFSVEWVDKHGQVRGTFNIPGRIKDDEFFLTYDSTTYYEGDVVPDSAYTYEKTENCTEQELQVWEIENTATGQSIVGTTGCAECGTSPYSKIGKFGYYETKDLQYPNTSDWDVWGIKSGNFVNLSALNVLDPDYKPTLKCQKIRHHRFPSHNLSHLHGVGQCVTTNETICEEYDEDGNCTVETIVSTTKWAPDDCVNLLGVKFSNIDHPRDSAGNYIPDIAGYRILWSDRTGHKSILYKGLVFNVNKEEGNTGEPYILYPNYPYNDLNRDVFLGTTQSTADPGGSPETPTKPQNYQLDKYTFHSPDIHYQVNDKGTEIKFYTEEVAKLDWEFGTVYKHPRQNISGADTDNARQFNSVADYEGYQSVDRPFNNRRKIDHSQYLLPIKQFVNDNQRFNNNLRENSIYLDLDENFYVTSNRDVSRFRISELNGTSGPQFKGTYCTPLADSRVPQAVSYYTGIKVKQPNQYGQLESIKYKPFDCWTYVNFEEDEINTYVTGVLSGGDIHISKHTNRRKHPFFTQWLYDVPFDTVFDYREYANVYKPLFWIDYDHGSGHTEQLDVNKYFYIFSNGTLNYWCESEYVGDYRDSDSRPTSQFYPKSDYVFPVRSDNFITEEFFVYNLSLLSQNIESSYQNLRPTKSDAEFIVTYSLRNDQQAGSDKWLQFLPLNYTVLPRELGQFTGMFTPVDYSIFFVFENDIVLSKADYTLQTQEGQSIFLGQGDIFSQRLQRLGNDKTGYVGSVDPRSFINTRFGTFWIDRYRKKIFMYDNGVKDITSNMSSWFNRYFSNGNPGYFNSVVCVFDNFTSNLFIINSQTGWTLSFKPQANGFVSWHSFNTKHALSLPNTFVTANDTGLWKHNRGNYQTYYGQVKPFEVGFVIKGKSVLQDLAIWSEWIRYEEYKSHVYTIDKFFNKLLVYNNHGSTGLMNTILKSPNNETYFSQNNQTKERDCEVTQVEDSEFRINKLTNFQLGQPNYTLAGNGVDYAVSNIVSKIPDQTGNVRGKWFIVHLKDEGNIEYKKLLQFNLSNTEPIKQ